MSQRDPQRWRAAADAPPLWSELVAADEADAAPPAALQRVLRGVASELGRPELAPPLTAASSAPAASASSAALKLGLAVVALAVGFSAYWWSQPRDSLPRSVVSPPPSAPAPQLPHEHEHEHERADEHELALAPPVTVPSPRASRPRPATGALLDPAAEVALLERAQRSLASDPRGALALAERHRRTFPEGALAQEREMLAIDALLRLGQRRAGERRARSFERDYPASSHRARLADLLSSRP